jgi:outer membrane protein assembly factor BamE (lipoprotein component of BamABCDE complex)
VALSPADLERAAADLAPGTSAERVRELLGEPRAVSELGAGGQTWVYLEADAEAGRYESLSLAFDDAGRFVRVERKAID